MNSVKKKAFELFSITDEDALRACTMRELKRKYHELCLIYHPDRRTGNDVKTKKYDYDFVDVKNAYEYLVETKSLYENSSASKIDDSTSYSELWDLFDSLFNIDNFQKILKYIEKVSQNTRLLETIQYNVTFEQVYNKNVFFDEKHKVYIPLWHSIIHLNDVYDLFDMKRKDKNTIYKISISDLLENVKISANNDVLVKLSKSNLNKYIINGKLNVKLSNSFVKILDYDESKQVNGKEVKIYEKQGIPRICRTNLYDTQEISNLIVIIH